jgi:hypothetical protein
MPCPILGGALKYHNSDDMDDDVKVAANAGNIPNKLEN